jgi:hypothetical protein
LQRCAGHYFPAGVRDQPVVAIDLNPSAGLLESCPTLGQGSIGFRVYEAAVRDDQQPANCDRWECRSHTAHCRH